MNQKPVNKTKFEQSLAKTYQPAAIEQSLYAYWEQNGYFQPHGDNSKESFCIVLPPPNVTGNLHIGHAFQQTIMDTLIRYHRMQGKQTLWQSGTDHAGIATQMVVERKIAAEEHKTRHDYGREKFIEKIWEWKGESSSKIDQQMRRLGNSVDWERERFTMDEGLSQAVKKAFISLYEDDLIYKGKRLVNWDPKLQTAISDLEVDNREVNGFMWYLRYPLADGIQTKSGQDYLVIATTRPETMLGDTGIAVNPDDLRYKDLIGKHILLPLVNRRIPIIGDEHADVGKETGCIKITPAHDFNDYEISQRHQLPMINIFNLHGHIRQQAEVFDSTGKHSMIYPTTIPIAYQGMERFAARQAIVSELERLELLVAIKPHKLTIPYGDIGGVIIEPMLINQWYVRTFPLAEPAIAAVKEGRIKFIPKQYENMYLSWMQNIQDWCISRQLWWGHRIPAWYDNMGNIYVGTDEKAIRSKHNIRDNIILQQDEDVLDTWFSSGLWTFATLGWPENSEELKIFHPTNVLVSGFDIIFFWIARMIMLTMYFIKDDNGKGQIPFKTVYITGLIRDEEGKKISKSKGNVIDPIDFIDGISLDDLLVKRTGNMMKPQLAAKIAQRTRQEYPQGIKAYGTDALRFTLAALASTGRAINWDMKRLTGSSNFCNKLWHASSYVIMNTEGQDCGQYGGKMVFSLADRWIKAEWNQQVKIYREALDSYRFDIAANILYEFTWNQFCDWYLELSKPAIQKGHEYEIRATRYTLIEILESLLRLAHPIIPFITETIWQRVKVVKGIKQDTIMLQSFPIWEPNKVDEEACYDFEFIKKIIIAIRNIRAEMHISPSKPLEVLIKSANNTTKLRVTKNETLIKAMARITSITMLDERKPTPLSVTKLIDGTELLIPMADVIDKDAELVRLDKELEKLTKEILAMEIKLSNDSFVSLAPAVVVQQHRQRLALYLAAKKTLTQKKTTISSMRST